MTPRPGPGKPSGNGTPGTWTTPSTGGGALIIERRRVPPQDEEITLGPANLVYVPYWVVEGWTGRLVIDAVTGEVLEEDSTPFAD